ncbi:DUF4983 domain-containing protein [Parapedobacter sp. 10938]|uniref:DUF4983 domain-containing protein n=1 Tax=Parapedobacter flavus TaxID=3110225 RepID=UPI002DB965F2|nr:DUF4983 domain-containing protein [Parapedobacter sp. 10938]MEC3881116.1 DUF4983 domain-containing protein [Parapedobacter sp. 10938]
MSNKIKGIMVMVALLGVFACQEQFGRLIPETDHSDTVDVQYGDPKVLLVIVDGVRGQSIQEIEPPTVRSLLNTAIHSWVSVSDEGTVEPGANWASMLTGVSKSKHGVLNNDFDNADFDAFPPMFERLREADNTIQSALYTSSALFGSAFSESADQAEVLADDAAVTAAAAAALVAGDEDVFTVHFTSPNAVGAAQGYDASVPAYREAIMDFDTRLGELLTAMRSRADFDTEKWLVVVTSSIGGDYPVADDDNDNTIFSRPLNNTFTIFSSPTYKTRYIAKPFAGNRYQGNFIRFDERLYGTVTDEGDNSVYNFGEGSFAIELKVKKNKTINQIYPALLSKRGEWNTETDSIGWTVFLEDNYWRFNARGTTGGGQISGGELSDGTWNSIAIVGRIVNGERVIITYTNGVRNNEVNVKDWGAIDNEQPLRIGYMGPNEDWDPDAFISDVRIWKLALAEEVVNQYACEIGVDENHPYYDALAGYWPVTNYDDGQIEDLGPLGNHVELSNTGESSVHLNELICAPSSEDLAANVPRAVDVPLQILTWLKVFAEENWQLDGRVWIDQ